MKGAVHTRTKYLGKLAASGSWRIFSCAACAAARPKELEIQTPETSKAGKIGKQKKLRTYEVGPTAPSRALPTNRTSGSSANTPTQNDSKTLNSLQWQKGY